MHRGGDVYGDGVNIASRIEPLAGAGGICVSMDVERQIRNAVETRFEKLAPTELKNISVPMDLFRIVLPWERQSDVTGQKSEVRQSRIIAVRSKWVWAGAIVLARRVSRLALFIGSDDKLNVAFGRAEPPRQAQDKLARRRSLTVSGQLDPPSQRSLSRFYHLRI